MLDQVLFVVGFFALIFFLVSLQAAIEEAAKKEGTFFTHAVLVVSATVMFWCVVRWMTER